MASRGRTSRRKGAARAKAGGRHANAARAATGKAAASSSTEDDKPGSRTPIPGRLTAPVLVLNLNYVPVNVCTVRRAIVLVAKGKAELLEQRTDSARIRTFNSIHDAPSIIRLVYLVKRPFAPRRLSKKEVFLRDHYTCQYCGTALRNSGHLGRIGDWAERAAASNCASIHMVNVRGSLIVAPFGAVERRGSTSPFCAGVPLPDAPPIIHDFATSVVAEGKAMVALHGGKPLPGDALVDADGNYTSDPHPLYGETPPGRTPNPHDGPGALAPFGLHKGSGLNFFMEMFGGALTGSGTAAALGDTEKRRFCNGMLSIYMQVDAFHDDDWFTREVNAYVEYWKAARPSRPGGEVLVPGEKERMTMAERRESGLPLSEGAWEDILAAAERVGMSDGEVRAALG